MTFLQPIVLWGLPLILLPVIIHLLNRMRHRVQPWAATRFLQAATRNSINHAKIRQWLILLFRVLTVLMLVLFVGRPLAGGWLGWALSPAPDAVLLLLDRSPSMEARVAAGTETKREQAIRLLSEAAKPFEEKSHLILIESALRTPQEIFNAGNLKTLSLASPTDVAADLPGMLKAAATWLVDNRAGTAEIWIASDLQRSNWKPEDERWKTLTAQFSALPQKVRIRLLALTSESRNASVSIRELVRRAQAQGADLQVAVDIQRTDPAAEPISLGLNIDGTRSQTEVRLEGQSTRWRSRLPMGQRRGAGWGSFELPADSNARDNASYFVYGGETPAQAVIVASNSPVTRVLQIASAVFAAGKPKLPEVKTAEEWAPGKDDTLLIWQAPLPEGTTASRVREFVEQGGVAIFLPPGAAGAASFQNAAWGDLETTSPERPFRVPKWDENEGPLARTDEGFSLPLGQAAFITRQKLSGPKNVLAAYDDGAPFFTREILGRGELYFLNSLPSPEWSSLDEGTILVPIFQRCLQTGSRRLQQAASWVCGELPASAQKLAWTSVDAPGKDIRSQAGVYRAGEQWVAVNRPEMEDDIERLAVPEAEKLFVNMPIQALLENKQQTGALQGEIWRIFLLLLLLFLIAEGLLILPSGASKGQKVERAARPREAVA